MKHPNKVSHIVQLQAYARIGGFSSTPPLQCGLLQTDGSFYHKTGFSRVAMILKSENGNREVKDTQIIPRCVDSTETEWASVSRGLLFALEEGERNINVENDNFSVVSHLILRDGVPKQEYVKYFRHVILTTASKYNWVGIRWVPREMNKADELFRKQLK